MSERNKEIVPPAESKMANAAVAVFGVWAGLVCLAWTSADVTEHEKRAMRDTPTSAVVLDWQVAELDEEPFYSTEASVRFTTESEEITTDLKRSGNHEPQEVVEIVYDRAHPADADFADRPQRSSEEVRARGQQVLSGFIVLLSTVGFVASATKAWRLHHHDARRTRAR